MNPQTVRHMPAGQITPTHLGHTVTARDRATVTTRTGALSDYATDARHGHVTLYAGGHAIELRAADTVTIGTLPVLGGAS